MEKWASYYLGIYWAVRWAAKGLMPVKPVVHLKPEFSLSIDPGHAIKLSVDTVEPENTEPLETQS